MSSNIPTQLVLESTYGSQTDRKKRQASWESFRYLVLTGLDTSAGEGISAGSQQYSVYVHVCVYLHL